MPRDRFHSIPAGLAAAAAVAAVVGGLLPLDTAGDGSERSVTAWTGYASDGAANATGVPVHGIALTVAALVLAAAVVLLLRGANRAALAAAAAGAGLLVGLVAAIRLAAAAAAHNVGLLRARFTDMQLLDSVGVGAWVLGAAAVLGAGAALLTPREIGPPGGSRPFAAIVALIAAGLTVTGSLLAVTVTTAAGDPPRVAYVTAWRYGVEAAQATGGPGPAAPLTGVPLAIAVVALLLGALLVLDMHGADRAAPLLTAGTGVLVGVLVATWTAWLALSAAQATAALGISTVLGPGAWVLLAATAVAAALCAVLWIGPARRRRLAPSP